VNGSMLIESWPVFTTRPHAMQTAVLARGILSVRLSVCPFVTYRYFVHDHTIVRFSAPGKTIIVVSGQVKFIQIFAGDHPSDVVI